MNETAELKVIDKVNSEKLFKSSPITVDSLDGRGGSFLVVSVDKGSVFSREKFTEQHKMFESAAREFAIKEFYPFLKI